MQNSLTESNIKARQILAGLGHSGTSSEEAPPVYWEVQDAPSMPPACPKELRLGIFTLVLAFDSPDAQVIEEVVNELLVKLIQPGSQAKMYFESTDSAAERDGRRALLHLSIAFTPGGACGIAVPGGPS
ncbi:hypothetical protein CYMTET_36082 [Cymbomonas tetramitiformis]|uniref:Uncharacterized protein n=1 Tax=Cymbomonas tetramitiformis TaxID=36881 RepID=A0AAE0F7Y1_9CHLO|nr:hypothetical protein CYMTET_36082 [Cymbomonas tetramitiformis]